LSRSGAFRTCWASLFCFSWFCVAPMATAQHGGSSGKNDYALIYGTVWGPDDRPAPGVHVSIRRASDKKPKWQLISDRRGEFAQRVPVGAQDYIVQAELTLPKGQPRPQVSVHIDDNEREDISLHLTSEQVSSK